MNIPIKKYLTTAEAAEYLGLSATTLNKWRCYGNEYQPPWVSIGRLVRYSVEDLDAWVRNNKLNTQQLSIERSIGDAK